MSPELPIIPKNHETPNPVAVLVMGGATIGLLFNFLYFREQFCMIACPYGRFQCVDACDDIMGKIGKPAGLIRYTSQDDLAGLPTRLIRARTVIYPTIISVASVLFWSLSLVSMGAR